MITAGNQINDRIDSGHRLVTTTPPEKMAFQRREKGATKAPFSDQTAEKLSDEKKTMRKKTFQSFKVTNIINKK